jgi:hypothetical protein
MHDTFQDRVMSTERGHLEVISLVTLMFRNILCIMTVYVLTSHDGKREDDNRTVDCRMKRQLGMVYKSKRKSKGYP